ncbi:hypothetical protein CROQUDRAFT_720114 [Cronartium quercuum f. sp. fusiforme G11]|uniref:Cleavage and polyadenylation specificity factor subunit 2 n=1 Tax=Cronartium quercuum f. sp. fusiforme G11 TaxID=708437 RepID=A0A9P6NRH6_9BASI|nr:hypothetical protein CROQUDRAFT_720114 [Cronartium quercuum f. sp. fusiforme G11]
MAITITPLSFEPDCLSYLINFDNALILIDCGYSNSINPQNLNYLERLADLAHKLDLLIISHPLLSSLALVPYLRVKLGLRCPIYATLPTKEMGRWTVEEWVIQRATEEPSPLSRSVIDHQLLDQSQPWNRRSLFEPQAFHPSSPTTLQSADVTEQPMTTTNRADEVWKVSLKELRDTFDGIIAVRYSQPIHLAGKLRPLTLTAHRSGHTIGGTIWTLRSPLHTVSSSSSSTLIYAPIFNHLKERHLDSAALLTSTSEGMRVGPGMGRPMVMMVGTERSVCKSVRRKDRDQILLDNITSTLRNGNTVLVPTDASARLIELLLLLDAHWTTVKLDPIPLCLVSATGKDVVAFVRSLTEWMNPLGMAEESLKSRHQHSETHGLLRFRHVKFFNSPEALEKDFGLEKPKLILAVPACLSYGYSRRLFTKIACSPGNLLVLTSMGQEGSLARWLAEQAAGEEGLYGSGKLPEVVKLDSSIEVELKRRVILEGEELEQYIEEKRKAKERRAKHEAMLARSRRMVDEEEEDDESDSDSTSTVSSTKAEAMVPRDEFVDEQEMVAFDIYVKGGSSRHQRLRMFPFVERRRKVDVYGEVLDVDGWLRRGDGVQRSGAKAEGGGVKRKWDDAGEDGSAEPPSKFVSNTESVNVCCQALLIDLEGKADARALQTIMPQINPKSLVLIHGTPASHQAFTATMPSLALDRIFAPKVGESSVVGHEAKSFSVRLGDGLMSSLRLSKIEGFEVGFLTGTLQLADESTIPTLDHPPPGTVISRQARTRRSEGLKPDSDTLEPLPLPPSIFIGDLRLATLRTQLSTLGIPAEFAAEGVLVCGPVPEQVPGVGGATVAVRKSGKGELVIEGPLGITFGRVKEVVYGLHAAMGGT